MMTALVEAMQLIEQKCRPYIVITCDQQQYKILVNIKWVTATKFVNVTLRLGGMHFLMYWKLGDKFWSRGHFQSCFW